jgi:hypothetical protein
MKLHRFLARKPEPLSLSSNIPITWAVGSETNATRFQYSRGKARAV